MKTSSLMDKQKTSESIYQLASHLDNFKSHQKAPPRAATPFADLMMKPDKLEAALKSPNDNGVSKDESQAEKSRKSKRTARSSRQNVIATKFQLEAHAAASVKLAADFTDWDKSPLDMSRGDNGVWSTTVPLPPGDHAYRFIVDGKWFNDPHCLEFIPNPFGTANSVKKVQA